MQVSHARIAARAEVSIHEQEERIQAMAGLGEERDATRNPERHTPTWPYDEC